MWFHLEDSVQLPLNLALRGLASREFSIYQDALLLKLLNSLTPLIRREGGYGTLKGTATFFS